jgi:hypothetical protein
MRRRLRGRFALGFAVAGTCVVLAGLLWAGAIVASWQHDCRAPGAGGSPVQKPMSVWPPGVKCIAPKGTHGARRSATYVHEAIPAATTAIVALGAFAAVALLAGIVAGVRDRRRRQPEPPPVAGLP